MKKYRRHVIDYRIGQMLNSISANTGKSKQESSVIIADFLTSKKKDLNTFVQNNKQRKKYEIRF